MTRAEPLVLLAEAVVVDHFITEAERYDASVSLASRLDADARVIALTASGVPAATSVESGNRSPGAPAANDLKEAMTRFDRALAVLGNGGSLGAVWAKARPHLETVAA